MSEAEAEPCPFLGRAAGGGAEITGEGRAGGAEALGGPGVETSIGAAKLAESSRSESSARRSQAREAPQSVRTSALNASPHALADRPLRRPLRPRPPVTSLSSTDYLDSKGAGALTASWVSTVTGADPALSLGTQEKIVLREIGRWRAFLPR